MFKPVHSSHTPITSASVQRTHFTSSRHSSVLGLYSTTFLLLSVSITRFSSDSHRLFHDVFLYSSLPYFGLTALLLSFGDTRSCMSLRDMLFQCQQFLSYAKLRERLLLKDDVVGVRLFISVTFWRLTQDAPCIISFWIFRVLTKNFLYKWCYVWSHIAGEQW